MPGATPTFSDKPCRTPSSSGDKPIQDAPEPEATCNAGASQTPIRERRTDLSLASGDEPNPAPDSPERQALNEPALRQRATCHRRQTTCQGRTSQRLSDKPFLRHPTLLRATGLPRPFPSDYLDHTQPPPALSRLACQSRAGTPRRSGPSLMRLFFPIRSDYPTRCRLAHARCDRPRSKATGPTTSPQSDDPEPLLFRFPPSATPLARPYPAGWRLSASSRSSCVPQPSHNHVRHANLPPLHARWRRTESPALSRATEQAEPFRTAATFQTKPPSFSPLKRPVSGKVEGAGASLGQL